MEECHSNMVSEVQRERILPEVVLTSLCDIDDFVPNIIESGPVDESVE